MRLTAQPISILIYDVMCVWFYDTSRLMTNLQSDWRRQDPGAGDTSTSCTPLPDPLCEGVCGLRDLMFNTKNYEEIHYKSIIMAILRGAIQTPASIYRFGSRQVTVRH